MLYFELVLFVVVNLVFMNLVQIVFFMCFPNLQESINKFTSVSERRIFRICIPLFILKPLYYLVNPKYSQSNLTDKQSHFT